MTTDLLTQPCPVCTAPVDIAARTRLCYGIPTACWNRLAAERPELVVPIIAAPSEAARRKHEAKAVEWLQSVVTAQVQEEVR